MANAIDLHCHLTKVTPTRLFGHRVCIEIPRLVTRLTVAPERLEVAVVGRAGSVVLDRTAVTGLQMVVNPRRVRSSVAFELADGSYWDHLLAGDGLASALDESGWPAAHRPTLPRRAVLEAARSLDGPAV